MFLSAALVAAAFASCSQDETIDVNNGQGIGFRAFTESQTRAYDVNIDSLKSFTVYALQGTSTTLGEAAFVWKDVFNKKGEVNSGTANFTSQTTHYWPSSGTMFFFAYNEDALTSSAQTVTPVINGTTQTLPNFQPNTAMASQKDLLVAYSGDQTKTQGAATLHFKHALSQIKVKALNTNTDGLQVKILGVRINGLNSTATFTYPNSAATAVGTALQTTDWNPADNSTNKSGDYIVKFDGTGVADISTLATELTADAQTIMEAGENGNKSFMVLPQTLTSWDGSSTVSGEGDPQGAYISVLCQISVPSGVDGGWTQYFPSIIGNEDNEGKFAWTAIPFPANTKLEPGYCYTYTLKFGEGAGTTDPDQPDPGTDPEVPVDPGQPVLGGKLSFDVTVSGWQDSSHDVDMKPSNN